eukprot:s1069_g5.t1
MQGNDSQLDKHVTRLSTDPRVTMLLLPLPNNQRLTDVPDKPKATPAPKHVPRPAAKNANKRKTRAERDCPDELKGYTAKGERGSGGASEGHTILEGPQVSAFSPDVNCLNLSDDEMKDCVEEPPSGETPQPLHDISEEMPNRNTQDGLRCVRNFNGMPLEDLYVIEIFAGSARLSKVARDCGFRTMAVDHTAARSCGFPICSFDLTNEDDLHALLNFLDEAADCILAVWIAPPCGTSSRAREKKLPQLEALGMKVPGPLRSLQQPGQLDGLSGVDKIKVEKANMLYDAVYTLATKACELCIFTAIENPSNSHYWGTTPTKRLCEEQQHHYVNFHTCAHGGDRDKATSLWVNDNWLDELSLFCDGKHKHKPWTTQVRGGGFKFATKDEAAYPVLLCERIINCLKGIALQLGAQSPETMQQQAAGPTRDKH